MSLAKYCGPELNAVERSSAYVTLNIILSLAISASLPEYSISSKGFKIFSFQEFYSHPKYDFSVKYNPTKQNYYQSIYSLTKRIPGYHDRPTE